MAYKKKAIFSVIRRDVARKYGCAPGESVIVPCRYCKVPGEITWWRLRSGEPGAWVSFGHELDHFIPESLGGATTASNLVLACRPCNRRKGVTV